MTPQQRRHYNNGIWLCAAHAPFVDMNWPSYDKKELREIKRKAEANATHALEQARAVASLRPVLQRPVAWIPPELNDSKSGYSGLWHVEFELVGNRTHRGRAVIDVKNGTTIRTQDACIGSNDEYRPEWRALRPRKPYRVPVFTRIQGASTFWLHELSSTSPPVLSPGTYLTSDAFIRGINRHALATNCQIRVRVILGDTAHVEEFLGKWKDVKI